MQLNAVRTLTVRGQSQGLDKVTSDLGKVSAAQERVAQTSEGMARTTETSSRRQLSAGRDFQRLMERSDRLVYLQAQLSREMATVNRAFEQDAVDAQQHARAVELVEGKYRALVAAETAARASSAAAAAANDNQAASLHRLAAANDNAAGSSANIAAQFQDIGVTAAMGMNPIMIALQQGTQLSAVLNTMKNPVAGLATAFVSILNPVSLLTIGFVALTATAIQFFSASNDNADNATDALERHNQWLDKTLAGYDRAREAAEGVLDAALKLPQGVVIADLQFGLREQEEAGQRVQEQVDRYNAGLAQSIDYLKQAQEIGRIGGGETNTAADDAIRQLEAVAQLNVSIASSRAELSAAATAWKEFHNSTEDPAFRQLAADAYTFIEQLMRAQDEIRSTDAALTALDRDIQIRITMTQQYGEASEGLNDLYIDPRDRFTVMREQLEERYETMNRTAQSVGQATRAYEDYNRVLGSIDAAEAKANAKSGARGAAKVERDLKQLQEAYAGIVGSSNDFIATQQLEASVLSMAAEAANRLRYEQNLLNEAKAADIALTPAQRQELSGLAAEMARAEAQFRSMAEAYSFSKDVFVGFGTDWISGFRQRLANADTAHEEARLKNINDLMQQAQRDGTLLAQEQKLAIIEMAQAMADAEHGASNMERVWRSAWEAMADATVNALQKIADRAADQLLNGLFDQVFGMAVGAFTGGFGGNPLSLGAGGPGFLGGGNAAWGGLLPNAKGNVFDSPSLSAYSNQIYDTPKWFKFANGAGVFGEAGPEAIMPLGRDSHGRLGVRAANSSIGAANQNGPRITVHNHGTPQRYEVQSVSRDEIVLIARDEVQSFSKNELPHRIRDISNDPFGN